MDWRELIGLIHADDAAVGAAKFATGGWWVVVLGITGTLVIGAWVGILLLPAIRVRRGKPVWKGLLHLCVGHRAGTAWFSWGVSLLAWIFLFVLRRYARLPGNVLGELAVENAWQLTPTGVTMLLACLGVLGRTQLVLALTAGGWLLIAVLLRCVPDGDDGGNGARPPEPGPAPDGPAEPEQPTPTEGEGSEASEPVEPAPSQVPPSLAAIPEPGFVLRLLFTQEPFPGITLDGVTWKVGTEKRIGSGHLWVKADGSVVLTQALSPAEPRDWVVLSYDPESSSLSGHARREGLEPLRFTRDQRFKKRSVHLGEELRIAETKFRLVLPRGESPPVQSQ